MWKKYYFGRFSYQNVFSYYYNFQIDPFRDFPLYNREWERYEEILREKETLWEEELKNLMEKSSEGGSEEESTEETSKKTPTPPKTTPNEHNTPTLVAKKRQCDVIAEQ